MGISPENGQRRAAPAARALQVQQAQRAQRECCRRCRRRCSQRRRSRRYTPLTPLYCTPSPTHLYRCISETGGAPLPLVLPLTPPGGAGLRGCGGDAEVCPRRARLAVRGDSKCGHSTYSEMAGSTRCAVLTMTMLTTTITASRAYCQPRFAISSACANPGCIFLQSWLYLLGLY